MYHGTGTIQFDPLKGTKHFDPWWALLVCDKGIADYYAWFLKRYGIEVNTASPWGTHISIIKGDCPPDLADWGKHEGEEMRFEFKNFVRYDNGKHAWLDVYSQDLSDFRQDLGLSEKKWFHLTVGRLRFTVRESNYGH